MNAPWRFVSAGVGLALCATCLYNCGPRQGEGHVPSSVDSVGPFHEGAHEDQPFRHCLLIRDAGVADAAQLGRCPSRSNSSGPSCGTDNELSMCMCKACAAVISELWTCNEPFRLPPPQRVLDELWHKQQCFGIAGNVLSLAPDSGAFDDRYAEYVEQEEDAGFDVLGCGRLGTCLSGGRPTFKACVALSPESRAWLKAASLNPTGCVDFDRQLVGGDAP